MGREAQCLARVGLQTADVKALLETTELILRGVIKRRYPVAAIADVTVADGELRFRSGDEPVVLMLGDVESRRWATKLATPPPSLASKLGIGPTQPAMVCGRVDDDALAAALQGAVTTDADAAHLLVAVVHSESDLSAAIAAHAGMACPLVWIVHPKGQAAGIGDALIRKTLRAHGYMDNKASAISDKLTATRYSKR